MLNSLPRFFATLLVISATTLSFSGCSLLPEQIDMTKDWSASRLYSEAHEEMMGGDYAQAIDYFEKLQARYPYDKHASQAELEIVYAYYKMDEPESAIAAADRFARMHPRHPKLDYVYYLRGLVHYNSGQTLLSKIVPMDASQRDPEALQKAFTEFSKLVEKFPESEYTKDARQRMVYTRNMLAEHEVHVARFYQERGALVAASKRASYVVENFQRTPAVPDALQILVKVYTEMGMNDLAADAQKVYDLNYSNQRKK